MEPEPEFVVEPEPEIFAVPESEVVAEPEPELAFEPVAVEADLYEPAAAEFGPVEPELVQDVGEPPADDWAGLVVQPNLETAVCLAYASTPRGYRLVEFPVKLPDVGQTIDVPDVGELVVMRIGRSPLPADTRICVYVDQPLGPPAALQTA